MSDLICRWSSTSAVPASRRPWWDSTGACPWHSGRTVAADESLETVLNSWLAPALELHRQQVSLIGHRVVHGGERFTAPTRITPEVEATLAELIPLYPWRRCTIHRR